MGLFTENETLDQVCDAWRRYRQSMVRYIRAEPYSSEDELAREEMRKVAAEIDELLGYRPTGNTHDTN